MPLRGGFCLRRVGNLRFPTPSLKTVLTVVPRLEPARIFSTAWTTCFCFCVVVCSGVQPHGTVPPLTRVHRGYSPGKGSSFAFVASQRLRRQAVPHWPLVLVLDYSADRAASSNPRRVSRSPVSADACSGHSWPWCIAARSPHWRWRQWSGGLTRRRRSLRRSLSDRPPQTPNASSLVKAYSKHSLVTGHTVQMRLALRTVPPCSGKNTFTSWPRQAASSAKGTGVTGRLPGPAAPPPRGQRHLRPGPARRWPRTTPPRRPSVAQGSARDRSTGQPDLEQDQDVGQEEQRSGRVTRHRACDGHPQQTEQVSKHAEGSRCREPLRASFDDEVGPMPLHSGVGSAKMTLLVVQVKHLYY